MGSEYTIHDVARLADTSITTVSRVLNNTGYPVSKELRARVLSAVRELNFSPNSIARSLKFSSNKEIGVVVPNISNPFYSQAILGIEKAVQKGSYVICLCNTLRDTEMEKEYLNLLFNKRVNGVIISAVSDENVIEFAKKGIHFVLLDQKIKGVNCSNINFDFRQGGHLATDYLIRKGHKKIALVTTPLTRWSRSEIYQGYAGTLAAASGEPLVLEANSEDENSAFVYESLVGNQMAEKFVDEKCDATGVICVNDMVAFGFIQGLHRRNIRVPQDVSVVGFDDIPFASMCSPALTTVRCAAVNTGMVAGNLLLAEIEETILEESSLKIEPEIVERDTVKDLTHEENP